MADVTYIRPELYDVFVDYQDVDNCCAGQRTVKAAGERYLPHPNPAVFGDDAKVVARAVKRYGSYLLRANFINFTGRTREGLSGLIFNRMPQIVVPDRCKVIVKNADGSGLTLVQLAKDVVSNAIRKGRCGLLVDYPETEKPATIADIEKGDIRPVILTYNPEAVINWDTATRGGKVYLTLVVLEEYYSERTPGDFEIKKKKQYRVLELVNPQSAQRALDGKLSENAVYRQQIYRDDGAGTWSAGAPVFPRDAKGQYLTEIPFTFVGSVNNTTTVAKAPLIDLANVNLAHYRNSADYEESLFLIGQPTVWASGLTERWIKEVLGGSIQLGSRSALLLNEGASVGLLQAEPNTLAGQGMKDKFEEAQKIGAKFVENYGTTKTATEASQDNVSENSVLSDIANNSEVAIKWCLEWCAIFTGDNSQDRDAKDNSIKFDLNKRFDITFLSANDRAQLLQEYQANTISWKEYRDNLRKSGLFLLDDDEVQKDIEKEMKENLDFEVERNKMLAQEALNKQRSETKENPQSRIAN